MNDALFSATHAAIDVDSAGRRLFIVGWDAVSPSKRHRKAARVARNFRAHHDPRRQIQQTQSHILRDQSPLQHHAFVR